MTLSRRKTLALIGGGTVLAAGAASAGFLMTRTPQKALAPWDAAGGYDDPRMRALSYALLAPNPHNRQPWLAQLVGDDGLTIWRDETRDLPVTDPYARQLTIGMGCFLSLMRMAAAEEGFAVEEDLFPEGETGPVAVCRFRSDAAEADPLFAYVMERRSHKEAFVDRTVGSEVDILRGYAQIITDVDEVSRTAEIAEHAWRTEAATKDAWQESVDLLRIGKREINAMPDGIDAGGPMIETLALLGLFTREAASDLENPGTQGAIEDTASAIIQAPAFAVQVTEGNTRIDQLAAGDQWLRLNLAAAGAGLALRPVSQALQEYPEVAPQYEAIHALYAPEGGTVQMLGLLGYGEQTPRTPRWPIETRMVTGW
ncbi:Acg family FMN-binding oxidoreductase [Aestuariibius sp. 2305UL40-4]|uniref:Acg family FMN-binding oxidoreductase n=1 Tax=Aestuariibius violaceus TaxID=3234132 RepID=UPI00345E4BFA